MHSPEPVVLGLLLRLEALNLVLLERRDGLLDPVSLDLCAAWAIAERSWSLWAVDEEHVGELSEGNTHGSSCAVRPVVRDSAAVGALDVELGKRSSHGVEARGQNDDIYLYDTTVACLNTLLSNTDDWIGINVNDVDMVHGHHFVEVLLQAGSLCAPWMWWHLWRKELLLLWVWDSLANSISPELICLVIGFLIEEHIVVCRKPVLEATVLDHELVVELLSLLRRIIPSRFVQEVVCEAGECGVGFRLLLFVPATLLLLLLFLRIKLLLIHWQAEVWRSLVQSVVACLRRRRLRGLNTGCSGTDLCHTFALEIHVVLRPLGGMVDRALEFGKAFERRVEML